MNKVGLEFETYANKPPSSLDKLYPRLDRSALLKATKDEVGGLLIGPVYAE